MNVGAAFKPNNGNRAAEMFKRLLQAGANMEFHPIGWESDIGPSYNYQVNVSNAFVTASRRM